MRLLIVLTALTIATLPAAADEIYKWTDASGRTHYSNSPPPKSAKASTLDLQKKQVTPADRAAAEARLARDRELLKAAAAKDAAPNAAGSLGPPKPAASAPTAREEPSECQKANKRFADSARCFDSFRGPDGKLRPEAFERCEEVVRPIEACPGP
jgi:hypothetical protein